MAHPRLQCRKTGYFARVAVPLHLRPIIGKTEVVRALKTANHKEAVERLHVVSVEIDKLFREAAKQAPARPLQPIARPATEEDVRRLVREWFWAEERASLERERAAGPPDDLVDALHVAEHEIALFAARRPASPSQVRTGRTQRPPAPPAEQRSPGAPARRLRPRPRGVPRRLPC